MAALLRLVSPIRSSKLNTKNSVMPSKVPLTSSANSLARQLRELQRRSPSRAKLVENMIATFLNSDD